MKQHIYEKFEIKLNKKQQKIVDEHYSPHQGNYMAAIEPRFNEGVITCRVISLELGAKLNKIIKKHKINL